MSILSLSDFASSGRQQILVNKNGTAGGGASWLGQFSVGAGTPANGVLAVGNTANGVVPTDATAGYPPILFGSGQGIIASIEYQGSVACRLYFFDKVFACGSYAFNAATVLASQPSYAARIPNGDYSGTQIWLEQSAVGTGVQNVAVTYTDQDGNAGATTGTFAAPAGATVGGSCNMLTLAAGDSGVQMIESVTGTVASAGTFNIFVARPLFCLDVSSSANYTDTRNFDQLGYPEVYADSAIQWLVNGSSGRNTFIIEIAHK